VNILFDENVPLPLRQFFHGHTVSSRAAGGMGRDTERESYQAGGRKIRRYDSGGQKLALPTGFAELKHCLGGIAHQPLARLKTNCAKNRTGRGTVNSRQLHGG
jgi:hypothetical protein